MTPVPKPRQESDALMRAAQAQIYRIERNVLEKIEME